MRSTARRLASLEDLLAFEAAGGRGEIVAGELVEKAAPTPEHADAQGSLVGALRPPFHRARGEDGPGGWWILPEVDIAFGSDVLRPDVAGWRRERVPERPKGWPVDIAPDWVCEVLSPSTAARDLGEKREIYHRHEVGWYWVVDVEHGLLLVYRRTEDAYALAVSAGGGRVHVEPFDGVALDVDALFGR